MIMATSNKRTAANRINGLKSHGPRETTSTRFNATKHGLLATGLTELDDAEGYRTILRELDDEINPVGTREMFLVEYAAVEMVRLRRAWRLEAEHIASVLNPPIYKYARPDPDIDPGLPAAMKLESVQPLVSVFQRYEAIFSQRLFQIWHELERRQRLRQGERLPAPAALDISVHPETAMEPGVIPSPQEETLGDNEDTAIERVSFPEPETEILGDQEVKA
jgi:hypothetical protein